MESRRCLRWEGLANPRGMFNVCSSSQVIGIYRSFMIRGRRHYFRVIAFPPPHFKRHQTFTVKLFKVLSGSAVLVYSIYSLSKPTKPNSFVITSRPSHKTQYLLLYLLVSHRFSLSMFPSPFPFSILPWFSVYL